MMPQTITILGYGRMARAIALGLNGRFPLEITGRNDEKIAAFIKTNNLNATALSLKNLTLSNRHIILCIRPHALASLSIFKKFTNQEAGGIYSVLAGISLKELKSTIGAKGYIRAMPNVAAELHASSTALCGDSWLKELAYSIFSPLGEVLWLDKESKLEAATALAGSGPAYLALIAEALTDAGVREGLTREESTALTHALFSGFSQLLRAYHPALIKEQVASPAGTTVKALALLERVGIRGIIIDAVHAAYPVDTDETLCDSGRECER